MKVVALLFALLAAMANAQTRSDVVVFWEPGFPFGDTGPVTQDQLTPSMPRARVVNIEALPTALAASTTLVLPYGSAFPESAWPSIHEFLQRGGNLVAVGGRPFTRPAYRDASGTWKLRDENYAYARALNLIDYQPTPGSTGLTFVANPDTGPLRAFAWKQAWSLVVRLSASDVSGREGSAGRIDARLTPLAWGEKDGRKLVAPAVQIDHLSGPFAGGRWILVPAEISADFDQNLAQLVARAEQGASDFRVQVASPLLLPDEPIDLVATWRGFGASPPAATVEVVVTPEHGREFRETVELRGDDWPVLKRIQLPPSSGTGLHAITATLRAGARTIAYRTGFWMRDLAFLRSGPKLTVNRDFFQLDGRTLPVMGTTYMASDAQRLFFEQPNPYVWDRDMAEISASSLNMLRTGWWSGWNDLVNDGDATERALRTMEAFLMTARRHNLPVQWTLFAFMPEVFGGGNPYLDPEALNRQRQFLASLASRFHDVPFLAWDLINEPSFDNPGRFWSTRPNGDAAELAAWNEWLLARYGDKGAIASAWRTELPFGDVPVPEDRDFGERAAYVGGHPVAAYDFQLFAQERFAAWASAMSDAIRAVGSTQLITVGQDEGGGGDRPSPALYAPQVDFTTTHTWWLNDALLWDSLVARVAGKPMLTQETGFQREWGVDARPRRDPESEASVLERKLAFALATGAGAIQWLWNVNAWMSSEQEVTIGAVRPDGTEKPEADVMRRFAKFAAAARDHLRDPELPQVAIVTAQTLQYSVIGNAAIEAQQRAVRVLEYELHLPTYIVTENNIGSLGNPKLVVLPSPQALSEPAWHRLIEYVRNGGNLLVTGSPERDDRWRPTARLHDLGIEATAQPLLFRGATVRVGNSEYDVQFSGARQLTLESLRVANGWAQKRVGKGTLFVAAYPLELAEPGSVLHHVYAYVATVAGVKSPVTDVNLPPSILVRVTKFADSILYLLVSETDRTEHVACTDMETHATVLRPRLRPGQAVLILLDRRTGAVLAQSD